MEIVRQKNVATYIVFPIVDADGDLVTGATGLDSEIDAFADGSAPDGFTDCTNEAAEIGTSGIYSLSLAQAEMNADYIVIQVKTSTSGAKTQVILIRTMIGDPANLATNTSGREAAIDANGNVALADGYITAAKIADAAITAAKVAADVSSEIADQVWNELLSGHAGVGSVGAALSAAGGSGDPWSTALPGAYGAGTAGKIIGDNLNATVGSRATQTSVDTIDDFLDTEIAAIKAKTDNLPASPAAVGSAMTLSDGAITAAKMAANCIGASQIAGDAIDADAISDSAGQEIATQVWNKLTASLTSAGSIGKLLVDDIDAAISSRASQASVDTVDGIVDSILVDTAEIGAAGAGLNAIPWNATWDAEVQSEVDDSLGTALTELSQGIPPATPTIKQALMLLYMALRNETNTTSSLLSIKNDAGTVICKATLSDDGSTFTRAEFVSGP